MEYELILKIFNIHALHPCAVAASQRRPLRKCWAETDVACLQSVADF